MQVSTLETLFAISLHILCVTSMPVTPSSVEGVSEQTDITITTISPSIENLTTNANDIVTELIVTSSEYNKYVTSSTVEHSQANGLQSKMPASSTATIVTTYEDQRKPQTYITSKDLTKEATSNETEETTSTSSVYSITDPSLNLTDYPTTNIESDAAGEKPEEINNIQDKYVEDNQSYTDHTKSTERMEMEFTTDPTVTTRMESTEYAVSDSASTTSEFSQTTTDINRDAGKTTNKFSEQTELEEPKRNEVEYNRGNQSSIGSTSYSSTEISLPQDVIETEIASGRTYSTKIRTEDSIDFDSATSSSDYSVTSQNINEINFIYPNNGPTDIYDEKTEEVTRETTENSLNVTAKYIGSNYPTTNFDGNAAGENTEEINNFQDEYVRDNQTYTYHTKLTERMETEFTTDPTVTTKMATEYQVSDSPSTTSEFFQTDQTINAAEGYTNYVYSTTEINDKTLGDNTEKINMETIGNTELGDVYLSQDKDINDNQNSTEDYVSASPTKLIEATSGRTETKFTTDHTETTKMETIQSTVFDFASTAYKYSKMEKIVTDMTFKNSEYLTTEINENAGLITNEFSDQTEFGQLNSSEFEYNQGNENSIESTSYSTKEGTITPDIMGTEFTTGRTYSIKMETEDSIDFNASSTSSDYSETYQNINETNFTYPENSTTDIYDEKTDEMNKETTENTDVEKQEYDKNNQKFCENGNCSTAQQIKSETTEFTGITQTEFPTEPSDTTTNGAMKPINFDYLTTSTDQIIKNTDYTTIIDVNTDNRIFSTYTYATSTEITPTTEKMATTGMQTEYFLNSQNITETKKLDTETPTFPSLIGSQETETTINNNFDEDFVTLEGSTHSMGSFGDESSEDDTTIEYETNISPVQEEDGLSEAYLIRRPQTEGTISDFKNSWSETDPEVQGQKPIIIVIPEKALVENSAINLSIVMTQREPQSASMTANSKFFDSVQNDTSFNLYTSRPKALHPPINGLFENPPKKTGEYYRESLRNNSFNRIEITLALDNYSERNKSEYGTQSPNSTTSIKPPTENEKKLNQPKITEKNEETEPHMEETTMINKNDQEKEKGQKKGMRLNEDNVHDNSLNGGYQRGNDSIFPIKETGNICKGSREKVYRILKMEDKNDETGLQFVWPNYRIVKSKKLCQTPKVVIDIKDW